MNARRCETCNRWFRNRKGVRFCSRLCCRRRPEYKKILSEREKEPRNLIRKLKYLNSLKGRRAWLRSLCRFEIRKALRCLGALAKPTTTILLYERLVKVVNRNKKKSGDSIISGVPDCKRIGVEFKIGIDYLRKDQLIYDILHGRKGKVRWLPSWDSLELWLEKKGRDESLFFDSYLSYLKWCDSKKLNYIKGEKQYANSTRS